LPQLNVPKSYQAWRVPVIAAIAAIMAVPVVCDERLQTYERERPDTVSPIPNVAVTKETYFKWLQFSRHLDYAKNPTAHGQYGPRHFLPILARYVRSGDPLDAEACMGMLRAYDAWLRDAVGEQGWHSLFCQEMGYIGLYQHFLGKSGFLLNEDKALLRELALRMARHIHPWHTPETYWRGPMHRAQGEGVIKGLAAYWHPDAPESPEWQRYADRVYSDWWRFRDLAPNDVNYLFAAIVPLMLKATLTQEDAFFTDPEVQPMWERLIYEVSPDGSIPPYGSHLGWNHSVGNRIALLELLAAKTKDGRFRFVAHRLMNYLLYQRLPYRQNNHILLGPETTEPLAIAYLFADDAIQPVQPHAGSKVLYRKETLRLSSTAPKGQALAVLGDDADLSPANDRSQIDCLMLVSDVVKPSKIAFRSGWERGDFFVLVDVFPRHDPLNPLGILGITRWGAALATTISAKGHSEENRIRVIPETPSPPGRPPVPEATIEAFVDSPVVTYAAVRVDNYDDTTATATRHFCFVKNCFLVVRDVMTTPEAGPATVSSMFNTQRVVQEVTAPAAVTYIDDLKAMNTTLNNPPINLLVSFFPTAGFELTTVDRGRKDEAFGPVPLQLQYRSVKPLPPRSSVVLGMLLRPQTPADTFSASANVDILKHDGDALVVVLKPRPTTIQIVVINPSQQIVDTPAVKTDAKVAYIESESGKPTTTWSHGGTTLEVAAARAP